MEGEGVCVPERSIDKHNIHQTDVCIIGYCVVMCYKRLKLQSRKLRKTQVHLIDCNEMQNQNHLVHKRTLNHFVKLASVLVYKLGLWIKILLQSLKLQLFQARYFLTFRQLQIIIRTQTYVQLFFS